MAAIASHASSPRSARVVRFCRTSRCLSVTLLALALVFLVSQGQPTAYTLQTVPLPFACFLFMLLGLAAAWSHPLGGGALTLIAAAAFTASTHAQLAGVALVFIAVAVLDVVAGWQQRRVPQDA